MNTAHRYQLLIDGKDMGSFPSLVGVYDEIEEALNAQPDFYAAQVSYLIEDHAMPRQSQPFRLVGDKTAGGMWVATCENPGIFSMYLDVIGWKPAGVVTREAYLHWLEEKDRYHFTITYQRKKPQGYRLKLYDRGEEVGGGVFPAGRDGEEDAYQTARQWLDSRSVVEPWAHL